MMEMIIVSLWSFFENEKSGTLTIISAVPPASSDSKKWWDDGSGNKQTNGALSLNI